MKTNKFKFALEPLKPLIEPFKNAIVFGGAFGSRLISILFPLLFTLAFSIPIGLVLVTYPGGLPAWIANALVHICTAGAPDCSFQYLYSVFFTTVMIVSLIITFFFISLHMSVHIYDVPLDDIQTDTARIVDGIEELKRKL